MVTSSKSQLSSASSVTSDPLAGQTSLTSTICLTQASVDRVRQASELQRKLAEDVGLAFATTPYGLSLPDALALNLNEFNERKQRLEEIRDVLLETQAFNVEFLHTLGPSVKSLFDWLHPVEMCNDGSMPLAQECLHKLQMLGVEIPKQSTPLGMYTSLREFVPQQIQAIAARDQEISGLRALLASMEYHIQIGLFLIEQATVLMTQPSGAEQKYPDDAQVNLRQHLMRIVINPIGTEWPVLEGSDASDSVGITGTL